MSNEPLPCPFCGEGVCVTQEGNNEWSIECVSADCAAIPSVSDFDKDTAIKDWNTRKGNDSIKDELISTVNAAKETKGWDSISYELNKALDKVFEYADKLEGNDEY